MITEGFITAMVLVVGFVAVSLMALLVVQIYRGDDKLRAEEDASHTPTTPLNVTKEGE